MKTDILVLFQLFITIWMSYDSMECHITCGTKEITIFLETPEKIIVSLKRVQMLALQLC